MVLLRRTPTRRRGRRSETRKHPRVRANRRPHHNDRMSLSEHVRSRSLIRSQRRIQRIRPGKDLVTTGRAIVASADA